MEVKDVMGFQHIIGIGGIILASLQLVLYYITSSVRREIDKQDARVDGVETRLANCWDELSECKGKCEEKRGKLKESIKKSIQEDCKLRHR